MIANNFRVIQAVAALGTWCFASLPATAEQPRRGGTLTYAVLGDPPTLDCHAASSFATMHYVSPHYSLLIKIDPNDPSKVMPDVATSWTASNDKLTYTFELLPGVTFHDGSPLTSADVKASFDRIRNPPQGIVSIRKSIYARIAEIETPDPLKVVFKLKTPSLDGFRAVNTSAQGLATALQSGQVMTQFRTLSPAVRDRLKSAMGDDLKIYSRVYDFLIVVAFNTKKAPLDDVRVRRALSLAIDRWAGAEALSKVSSLAFVGATQRPESPWAATEAEMVGYPGFGKDIASARAEAKRLLKEAGHENLKLKLVNRNIADPYTSAGIYLLDQWRQIGVTAEHTQVDVKTLVTSMRSGEFDAIIDFQGEGVDDPSIIFARNISADISSYNPSGFVDRKVDELYRRINSEFDTTTRRMLVRELESHLLTEAYQVPFLWLNRTVSMPSKVGGFIMTPSHFLNQDLGGLWLAE